MRAMVLTGHGDMDKLEFHEDWPMPVIEAGEVLVKINACGLNNTDVNTRTAWYSKGVAASTTGEAFAEADDDDSTWGGVGLSFPRIQGADVAGVVEAVAADVSRDLIGQRVLIDTWLRAWDDPYNLDKTGYLGSELDGGFAEYLKIDARQVHPINSTLTDAELATFATSYVTALNMLNRAGVNGNDTVLIPGASGGVGSALIQLASQRGATTVAMASTSKHDEMNVVGPDVLLSRTPANLGEALAEATGQRTVSVVLDVVGGPDWSRWIDVIARGGRYCAAGAIAGPLVEFDLRTFYLNDLSFFGATVVPPGTFAELVSVIERGGLKPLVAGTYALEDLHEAQRAFIAKEHVGNIVITI